MRTYWLLTSFSRMVEKSIGFLMTFLYPGTDFKLTGVRKGHASWWRSNSASSTLLNKKHKLRLNTAWDFHLDKSLGSDAEKQPFTGILFQVATINIEMNYGSNPGYLHLKAYRDQWIYLPVSQ